MSARSCPLCKNTGHFAKKCPSGFYCRTCKKDNRTCNCEALPQVQPIANVENHEPQVQPIANVENPEPIANVENQQVQENPQIQPIDNVENPEPIANVENQQAQENPAQEIRPRKRQKREITAESLQSNLIEWEKIPLEQMSKIAINRAKESEKAGDQNKKKQIDLINSLYQMGTKKRADLKDKKLLTSDWNMQTFLKKELESSGVNDVKICGDITAARTYIELLGTKEYSIDELPEKIVARQIGTLCGRTNDDDKKDKYKWLDGEWVGQRFLQEHIPAFYKAMSDELEVITSRKAGEYIKEHVKRFMTIEEEIKRKEKEIEASKKKTTESQNKTAELEKELAELKQRSDVPVEEDEEEEEEPQREMEMEVEYEN